MESTKEALENQLEKVSQWQWRQS